MCVCVCVCAWHWLRAPSLLCCGGLCGEISRAVSVCRCPESVMRVVIVAVCWHCVQEELLLTLEDYCSEQDVFANQGEHGHAYADLFAKVSNSLNPGSSSTVM